MFLVSFIRIDQDDEKAMNSDENDNTNIKKKLQRKIHVTVELQSINGSKGENQSSEKCYNVEGKLKLLS